MRRGLFCAGAIIMAATSLASSASADPVTLVCHGVGFVQNEAGPSMIELNEAQGTVTARLSAYTPPQGSYPTGANTFGPVQAVYGASEINFQDPSGDRYVLNRLTGDLKWSTANGMVGAGSWLCHAATKQF